MPATLDENEKQEILGRLFVVFRDCGYEGASLADLSRATGLGKSSLYHHFPRGKEQMAEAVLTYAKGFITSAIADVAHSSEPLEMRVKKVAGALNEVYGGGKNPCLWGRLTTAQAGTDARQTLQEIFRLWSGAIADLARESGLAKVEARHFAEDWLAHLQGALVLQAANGDVGPYERAMAALIRIGKKG